jgi:hypothetical protein
VTGRLPLVVVQNNHVERLTGPLAKAARHAGIALHDVSSGEHAGDRPLPEGEWSPILVVGSILFTNQWARKRPELAKWIFWDDAKYDAAVWRETIGDAYLNAQGRETTVGELQSSLSGPMHVRPRSGVKMVGEKVRTESQTGQRSIPGIVVTPGELADLRIDPATPIWAAPPREIMAEVRVWMIGGRAAAASTYRVSGQPRYCTDDRIVRQACAEASRMHGVWHPGRHYVVDVALTPEGMKVIEYNPIHSSGWYAADPAGIMQAFFESERGEET